MEFQVDVASRVPIYRQLCDQIRQAIAQGKLQPEDRLPSVRELSRSLVVNPNTIARVYTELEREGILHTRQGLGVFVAARQTDLTRKARRERLAELLDAFLTNAVHLSLSREEVEQAIRDRMTKFDWPPTTDGRERKE
jgi:GntR family transcriptional regulator